MTTKDFITKAFNQTTKARRCSSVFAEGRDVYSYGYHYPLLFMVANKVIRNVTGYSITTSRHISDSRTVSAIDIHCGHTFRLTGNNLQMFEELTQAQTEYIQSIKKEMQAKKRKNTQVYSGLHQRLQEAEDNLTSLTN